MVVNVVSVSGQHFYSESGAAVVVASGVGVTVQSGVYLASGMYVVADIAESGMGVQIQSGANVIISGQPVTISGGHVFVESGVYLASGLYVVADIAESGMGVQVQSGLNVIIASGMYLASGLVVNVSGETIVLTDAYVALGQALKALQKPLWLDQTVGALRTQQLSGVVTITGGSVTATVATTIVNVSGIAGFNPKDTWLNDERQIAWNLNVRQRIT